MITVKIWAGLANKMFQYAFYLSLKDKGIDVQYDSESYIANWDFENSHLDKIFKNIDKISFNKTLLDSQNYPIGQSNYDKFRSYILRKFNIKICFNNSYYLEPNLKYDPSVFGIRSDSYLVGFWQSEKYFRQIKDDVLKAFEFPPFKDNKNIELLKTLNQTNSVAIHVRKGLDYKKSSVNETCDIEYYKRSINLINLKVNKPKYFIFSDNFDWCDKHLNFLNADFVNWNDNSGSDNYIDMQLMSNCKHNIIANSSYSWWGAWLNNNPGKVVISPLKWFSDDSNLNYEDIVPENWIKL